MATISYSNPRYHSTVGTDQKTPGSIFVSIVSNNGSATGPADGAATLTILYTVAT